MELTFEQLPKAVNQLFLKLEDIERLLTDKNSIVKESDQFLTIEQAAEFLCLSKLTLYGKVSRHELPVNKRGKRLYFLRSELENYIKAGRKKTSDELRSEVHGLMKSGR